MVKVHMVDGNVVEVSGSLEEVGRGVHCSSGFFALNTNKNSSNTVFVNISNITYMEEID